MITFSIVVPTFQEAERIEACLLSIKDQSVGREKMEIIVSDARSTDATVPLARPLADCVVETHERGIALGRNRGAALANGGLFLFVDADATLAPSFLEEIDKQFADPSVVSCTGIALPADGSWFARFVYHGTYFLVRFFHWFGFSLFPGICVAYRADAFRAVCGFREDLGISEDLDLSRRISKLGKTKVVTNAKAYVSTRRLAKNGLSVVLFHILHHIRYLVTGTSAKSYPKTEELRSWSDLWKAGRQVPIDPSKKKPV
jgi:glycosyltransferase involved in cell wall biosynthesis